MTRWIVVLMGSALAAWTLLAEPVAARQAWSEPTNSVRTLDPTAPTTRLDILRPPGSRDTGCCRP